ncbi:phosphotransferase [Rhizobacter fulvus]
MPEVSLSPQLPADVLATLDQLLRDRGGLGQVSAVALRRLVEDHCDKFIVFSRGGQPIAFVVLSPPEFPRAAAQAAACAFEASRRLGGELGATVLTPLHVGESDGASYTVTAFCRPLSTNRWVSRWQRWRLAAPVFDWLHAVTRRTASPVDDAQSDALFAQPLEALAANQTVDASVRDAAAAAREALATGRWRPRTVLAHNDLWAGNLLRRPHPGSGTPFYVIDWAGARTEGHGMYDLVRVAMSLGVSPAGARRTVAAHCDALGCDPSMANHHLASALGHLSLNLGEWPAAQFAQTAAVCHRFLIAAR